MNPPHLPKTPRFHAKAIRAESNPLKKRKIEQVSSSDQPWKKSKRAWRHIRDLEMGFSDASSSSGAKLSYTSTVQNDMDATQPRSQSPMMSVDKKETSKPASEEDAELPRVFQSRGNTQSIELQKSPNSISGLTDSKSFAPINGAPYTIPQYTELIRTDQVQKLPHLNEQEKTLYTQVVQDFWNVLNSREPQDPAYQQAHSRFLQLSQTFMRGMRMYQQNPQLQHRQQTQAILAATQSPSYDNLQSFTHLLPSIQEQVNSFQFFTPLSISSEQRQTWLEDAKLQCGLALQKQEFGQARMKELDQQLAQRWHAGNITQNEIRGFTIRQVASHKLFREGGDFLEAFRKQQETLKAQQQGTAISVHSSMSRGETKERAPESREKIDKSDVPGAEMMSARRHLDASLKNGKQNKIHRSVPPRKNRPIGVLPDSKVKPSDKKLYEPREYRDGRLISGPSFIPRSLPPRKNRVSALAKHFEQLSRKFEEERQLERDQRAAPPTPSAVYALRSSSLKVYKDGPEDTEEEEDSDSEDNILRSAAPQLPVGDSSKGSDELPQDFSDRKRTKRSTRCVASSNDGNRLFVKRTISEDHSDGLDADRLEKLRILTRSKCLLFRGTRGK